MASVFVTGGTGLIGSNICEQLIERGDSVTALVRPASDASELAALGVRIVAGDITDPASVRAAAEGCEAVIHSAAVLGGASQDLDEHRRTNTGGIANVLDAAEALGMRKVVALGTTTYFHFEDASLSESSPLHPNPAGDPYTQTKRAAFVEAMARAERGLDVSVVIPGGTFGPAPCVRRSMEAPSYNLRIVLGARGEFHEAVRFPIPWSYAADVAWVAIAAMDRGLPAEKYLAFARPEDVGSMAMFVNLAMEIAGNPNRVHDITVAELDADPDLRARVGPSIDALARQRFPEPYFDNTRTRCLLGYEPTPLPAALQTTVAWLRAQGLMA
jgi:nucleoside-diphosphate-sugar epimerase